MKKISLILMAAVATGFSALAQPAENPPLAPPPIAVDWSKLPPAATNENVTFEKDIAPIFKASCVRCHSGDRARSNLRLDTLDGVMAGAKRGPVLTAGDSANSLLVKSVSQLDPKTSMPPKPRGPRGQRGPGGPGGTNAPPPGGPGGPGPGGEPPHFVGGDGDRPPGGPLGTNGLGMRPRNFGPPTKPLTAEQVSLVRAWIDQGAK